MTTARLLSLIIRHLDKELNSEELLELETWGLESEDGGQLLQVLTSEEGLRREIHIWENIDPAIGYSQWISQERGKQRSRIFKIRGWVAAASVIAAVAVFGIIRRDHFASPTPAVVQAPMPILPGRNMAILTLAGGQKVMLDSAKGNLGTQGNARIVKDNGSLAYSIGAGNVEGPVAYNVLSTPKSGQYQLILPDGSHVWLNNLSSIKYPTTFRGKSRRVELTGEAYFEIAADEGKPFIVSVNGEEVEVLGTSFNIMAYTDEGSTQTTLLTGRVQVKAGQKTVMLRPDEQAQGNGSTLTVQANVPSQDIISWKNGFFYFGRASFTEVMRQLARWYDIDVKYEGTPPDVEFGGKIDRSLPLNDLLNFLDKNKVHLHLEGRTLVVSPA